MEKYSTIGEIIDKAIVKVTAEMNAGRDVLSVVPSIETNINGFTLAGEHFAEAIDAILMAAGSFGGDSNKRYVLNKVLSQHGFELK